MSLSDRRTIINSLPTQAINNEKDVREFIKELKEAIKNGQNYRIINSAVFFKEEVINKLAGEKLI